MLGISGTELVIILFFGFLIFGPEKLPQMGRTVGRAIRQFRDASEAANKKFKEEVADPFQEAINPYKDQVEDVAKPLQEDIAAINNTINDTRKMVTDPFKDMFNPASAKKDEPAAKAGAVIAGAAASEAGAPANKTAVPSAADDLAEGSADDPFSDIFDDESPTASKAQTSTPAGEAKPIPKTGGTVKRSFASSLYDLDDELGDDAKDGE